MSPFRWSRTMGTLRLFLSSLPSSRATWTSTATDFPTLSWALEHLGRSIATMEQDNSSPGSAARRSAGPLRAPIRCCSWFVFFFCFVFFLVLLGFLLFLVLVLLTPTATVL